MNRFLPPITCGFVVIVAILVSSCVQDYAAPGAAYAAPRDAALRECNGEAQIYAERDWETLTATTYANCMTSHNNTIGRRSLLSKDEARRIAANIAKLPESY